jgi:hypothetical protein
VGGGEEELRGVLDGSDGSIRAFFGLPRRRGVVIAGRLPRLPAVEDSPSGCLGASVGASKRAGRRVLYLIRLVTYALGVPVANVFIVVW